MNPNRRSDELDSRAFAPAPGVWAAYALEKVERNSDN